MIKPLPKEIVKSLDGEKPVSLLDLVFFSEAPLGSP